MAFLTEDEIRKLPEDEQFSILMERVSKLPALLDRYCIETRRFDIAMATLAIRLACDFVPGFWVKTVPQKTKPKKRKKR